MSEDGQSILFGNKALEVGLSGQPSRLFERSPKAWLSPTEVRDLDQQAGDGVDFTRRELLTGLLAAAVQASTKAAEAIGAGPENVRYRISHPVWLAEQKEQLLVAYDSLRRIACHPTVRRVQLAQSADAFRQWCDHAAPNKDLPQDDWHVDEPIAAALDLLPDPPSNKRNAALIVDIGAGTIDLGLFISVVPDDSSRHRRKLIRMGDPRSLFGAGDVIDAALINLIVDRLGTDKHKDLARLRNDIRRNKEQLFENGQLAFAGVTVTRDELVATAPLKMMTKTLREALQQMCDFAGTHFRTAFDTYHHPIQDLDIVFAGGGARLDFLRSTIGQVVTMGAAKVAAVPSTILEPEDFGVDASRSRMAVALGGTTPAKYWPVTEMTDRT
ncbi:MAG: hypothetical protein K2W80_01740 [Burkholderiales bacterium]|nr:hypothetical protein [Burkholderiales bacterium]